MAEDTGTVEVTPGIDSSEHPQELHKGIAANLGEAQGKNIAPSEVVPPAARQPLVETGDVHTDTSLRERFMGVTEGEEPSNGFLKIFKSRLGRKNPGGEIKEK